MSLRSNRWCSIASVESCQRLGQRNSAMMAELLTALKNWDVQGAF